MIDIIAKIEEVISLLDELDNYYDDIPNKQSHNDLEISDIYHYIENNAISTKGCYRLIKELKDKLLIRRRLKQEQELLRTYTSHKNKLVGVDNRKMLMCELRKTEKRLNSPYNYRVYESEESLKEIVEH